MYSEEGMECLVDIVFSWRGKQVDRFVLEVWTALSQPDYKMLRSCQAPAAWQKHRGLQRQVRPATYLVEKL